MKTVLLFLFLKRIKVRTNSANFIRVLIYQNNDLKQSFIKDSFSLKNFIKIKCVFIDGGISILDCYCKSKYQTKNYAYSKINFPELDAITILYLINLKYE